MNKKTPFPEDFQCVFIKEGYEVDILRLYYEAGWSSPDERVAPEFITRVIQGSFAFLVVLDKSRVIGMGRTLSDGKTDAYIQDVVVLKKYRGYGIGREIVYRLLERLKSRGIDWIGLIAQPGTAGFYEKIGFERMNDFQPMKFKKQ